MVVVVVATIFALAWMFYRVSTLLNIPIPTLVKILGLDLPAPPRVSLHGVSADTITLHWSLPEKAGSVAKHIIQINGINVGESEKRGETSVTVTGLNPDQRYNVRVIAANAQNFQAPGQLIRLRTCAKNRDSTEPPSTGHKLEEDAPSVHSTSAAEVPPSPHHVERAHHPQQRRGTKDRRASPATEMQQHIQGYSPEDQHSVDTLTRDLEAVRKEIMETEAQLQLAEDDHKSQEAALRSELDEVKHKKNEEDAGRQRIRVETKSLEEARRTAEALRTRTEKSLRAKEYEVKRMQDDIARWDEEKLAAIGKMEELAKSAEKSKASVAATEKEMSNDIQETQKQIVEMEEEIRTLITTMKSLETQKEQLKAEEDEEAQKLKEYEQRESAWNERHMKLEMDYCSVYQAYKATEVEFLNSQKALANIQGRRESGSGAEALLKKPKQRRHRNRKSRTPTVSSSLNGYPMQDFDYRGSTFNSLPFQQNSPTFQNPVPLSPFFNIANGTVTSTEIPGTVTAPLMDYSESGDEFIGSTPMSPTANSLLPSNLFSFDDAPPSPRASTANEDTQPRSLPYDVLHYGVPQSPMSSGSVSTSPRSSFNHIPAFNSFSPGSQLHLEPDRTTAATMSPIGTNRPIGTAASDIADENAAPKSNSRRFVNLLSSSFNRQRGKTMGFDGVAPALGQLRAAESHSFPKNDPPGLDPIGTRRRSGSYGSWANGLDFLPGTSRRTKPLERTNSQHSRHSATFSQFSPGFDPLESKLFDQPPVSPRPSSIASFDNPLPVPSSDASAAFGWPTLSQPDSLPRAANWGTFNSGRLPASRPVSRPISPAGGVGPSGIIGSSMSVNERGMGSGLAMSGLSGMNNSTTSLGMFSNHTGYFNTSSPRPVTPRLNPAAPTFQSRMSTPVRTTSGDAISINTDASGFSGHSLESTTTKESILSRFSVLSRKSSTGKFWRRSGGKKEGDGMEEEDEETVQNKAKGAEKSTWGWKREGENLPVEEGEEGQEEKVTTPQPQPWLKSRESGFFSRKKEDEGDAKDEKEKRKSFKKEGEGKKGIFRRKEKGTEVEE